MPLPRTASASSAAASTAPPPPAPDAIEALRQLNRVLTQRFGLLRDLPYGRGLTLPQARIVFELARSAHSLSTLREALDVDLGYLSRLITQLVARKLVRRVADAADRRTKLLSLTATGRRAFAAIDAASREQVGAVLATHDALDVARIAHAGRIITGVLDDAPAEVVIRTHRPGDLGWIVSVHGELYAREYGWDGSFEGLVADIAGAFARQHDPQRERCWIAEVNGERVGSVMLVQHPDHAGVAKLRLLIVHPSARGLGIGKRLVRECGAFAKAAGYRSISLWTNSILHAARALYVADGYTLVASAPHTSFGVDLVGETWERPL
jgi:DNA-binding MarR family transcriptional regulator/GNAT superfamily N-acetyltransferase